MTRARIAPEARAAAILTLLVCALFAPVWLPGLTPFWGDLTYLHLPWQQSTTQVLQAGRMPLWDPQLYFGMPMAANMQRAVFYPGTLPFRFFGFASGAALFHALHYVLAGWLMWLWLRSLRLSLRAALAGAAVFMLGGGLLSRMSFLNHLAVLSLLPAFLLFFRRPALLALSLAAAFLAGYPPFIIGGSALAWAVSAALASPRASAAGLAWSCGREWLLAGLLAAGLSACQFLPGAELLGLSRRGGGMGLAETLLYGYSWRDLCAWVSPLLVPGFDAAVNWTRSSYAGFTGALAAVWGLWTLGRRRSAGLAALLGAVLLLILGGVTPASRALWEHLPPLRFVRYPGNLAYLGWPLVALLAAAGWQRVRPAWRRPFFALLAAELLCYGIGQAPRAPRGLFTDAGPLVPWLQERVGAGRYLLSPLALESTSGRGVRDWRWRLYGVTNDPYRLRAGGNFGEPLVPKDSYAFMDLLYRQPSAAEAARLLPGAGVALLLVRDALPHTPLLKPEGDVLWRAYRVAGTAALAWALSEGAGEDLSSGLPAGPLPSEARPLALSWPRDDRFEVAGRGRGWVFVAEPRYPGWRAVLESDGGTVSAEPIPAWGAFQKFRVPEGPWRLRCLYDPGSWRVGLSLTLLCLSAFGLYWYNLALRRARTGFSGPAPSS
ncbi:MAG: hypothetical protein HY926_15795 [Elusimicrobia bacterium]|nr:hypothetical protein [Elusimicrobiota bacterium]